MNSSEFKLLLMPYSARLYRMAYRLMNNKEEAEDMVQEVYIKLWGMREELHTYKSLEALAVRITRNLCLDHLRRRKVSHEAMKTEQHKAEQMKQDAYQDTPFKQLEKKEQAEQLRSLIAALPEPQRSLVHLRHMEGKEYEEIAEMVNMNVNAIRVSISRARKQMREILEKQYSSWRV